MVDTIRDTAYAGACLIYMEALFANVGIGGNGAQAKQNQ